MLEELRLRSGAGDERRRSIRGRAPLRMNEQAEASRAPRPIYSQAVEMLLFTVVPICNS